MSTTLDRTHTPGPWTAERDGMKWLVNAKHFGVATCDGPFGKQKYDASLIAAAPDLLAACKSAIVALKGREHDGFLRAAIAKAEGK